MPKLTKAQKRIVEVADQIRVVHCGSSSYLIGDRRMTGPEKQVTKRLLGGKIPVLRLVDITSERHQLENKMAGYSDLGRYNEYRVIIGCVSLYPECI